MPKRYITKHMPVDDCPKICYVDTVDGEEPEPEQEQEQEPGNTRSNTKKTSKKKASK